MFPLSTSIICYFLRNFADFEPKLLQQVIDRKRKDNAEALAGNGARSQVRASSGMGNKEGQGQGQASRRSSVSQQAPKARQGSQGSQGQASRRPSVSKQATQGSPKPPPLERRASISSQGQHNGSVNPFTGRLPPSQNPIHSGRQPHSQLPQMVPGSVSMSPPPPIESPRVPMPSNTYCSSDSFASSPPTRSYKAHSPEQFTTSGGPPPAAFQSSESGHILGSSPPTESSKPHKSSTQTPRQWVDFAIPKSQAPSTNSHSNRSFGQGEETGLGIILNGDLSNTINTSLGNFDFTMGNASFSDHSTPTPKPQTNNKPGNTVTRDSSSIPAISPFQPPARPASPKTVKHQLQQRYKDGMVGWADQTEEDTRRNGLAAQILGRMNRSLNKAVPQPRQTAPRSTIAPDFKHLGIASIRNADEKPKSISQACSWCYFEADFGLANDSCLLDAKAFRSFCQDCRISQHHFSTEYRTATRGAEMSDEDMARYNVMVAKWNLQAQISPLGEAVTLQNGQTIAQAESQAKKLPQNTKSVSDGQNVAAYRGILTCRGSALGQVDVKKARLCRSCKEEKFRIIKHDKHTNFHPIAQTGSTRDSLHSRRCMVCCSSATVVCAGCPLRICGTCETLLMRQCKSI